MPARIRKLIGSAGILVFLALYVTAAVTIADYVPRHWAAQLAFFVVVGVAWGAPLLPLITWMNRGR